MVGYMLSTAKVHAVDAKPKWKAKDKAPATTGPAKVASAPSSPGKGSGRNSGGSGRVSTRRVSSAFVSLKELALEVINVIMVTLWRLMADG